MSWLIEHQPSPGGWPLGHLPLPMMAFLIGAAIVLPYKTDLPVLHAVPLLALGFLSPHIASAIRPVWHPRRWQIRRRAYPVHLRTTAPPRLTHHDLGPPFDAVQHVLHVDNGHIYLASGYVVVAPVSALVPDDEWTDFNRALGDLYLRPVELIPATSPGTATDHAPFIKADGDDAPHADRVIMADLQLFGRRLAGWRNRSLAWDPPAHE